VPLVVDFRGPVGPERTRLMVKEQARSGMNQFFYPLDLIGAFVSLPALSEVAIAPETSSPETLLYFPMREFVRLDPEATRSLDAGRVKCVAFDLDDTLWRGILVEDGPNALELDEEVAVRIRQLGEIGIITSVVSKNDPAEALRLLDDFGLREFFVFPQIGWGPKSEALRRLSESLRIGVGSILLVDDSRHERAAVEATVAGAQTIGPEELDLVCNTLLSRKRLDRGAGAARASYYRTEEARQSAEADHEGDHLAFLRSLRARVGMAPPTETAMDRVQELIQRTNRLNFSGHRYTRPEVASLVADGCRYRCWTVTASDRFGDYGLVGFVIVDVSDPVRWHVQDLMFSCRILGRHVDLFVLTRVLEEARAARAEKVTVAFESSGRNEAAREALVHAGFVESDGRGYVFDLDDGEIRTIDYIEAA